VNASVSAIEQRDPTTSGHSFRVADLCVGLAASVSQSNLTRLRDIRFNDTEVMELKYAALLHDFGKVGVRESVLVKEKKLTAGSLENINYRIQLAQEKLRTKALNRQLLLHQNGRVNDAEIQEINAELKNDLQLLNEFYQSIVELNEPSVLKQDNRDMLERISAYRLSQDDDLTIISQNEFKLLTISRGSLSPEERKEIESHVVHTQNFLEHIPWTKELGNIPSIAAAHHEKLDGSGYPYGMSAAEIPTQSKIMTICDIYDALTASDRPYKPAMNMERAIDILKDESQKGLLDGDLVEVFIDAQVFQCINAENLPGENTGTGYSHHPCDVDLHKH